MMSEKGFEEQFPQLVERYKLIELRYLTIVNEIQSLYDDVTRSSGEDKKKFAQVCKESKNHRTPVAIRVSC
jgi:uncharacterized protein (UPF0335 family)